MNNKDKAQIISKDELLQGDWTPVRNEIWSSQVLSPNAKLCYIAIASHIWKGGDTVAWPGQQRLAKLIGVSDRSIRTYLTELEDAKLLVIDRRGLNMTNNYYICKPKTDILKPLWGADRKQASTQERKRASTPDRKQASDKEQAVEQEALNNNHLSAPVPSEQVINDNPGKTDDDVGKSKEQIPNKPSKTSGLSPETYDTEYFDTLDRTLIGLELNIPLTGGTNFRAVADVYEAGVPIKFATDAINALPRNKKGIPVGANGRKIYRFEYIKTTILNKWNEEQEVTRHQSGLERLIQSTGAYANGGNHE